MAAGETQNAERSGSLGVPNPSRPTTEAIGVRVNHSTKRTTEEVKSAIVSYWNLNRAEVTWYRKHGRHADRIALSGSDHHYVIGDWAWNRLNPNRREHIEDVLPR